MTIRDVKKYVALVVLVLAAAMMFLDDVRNEAAVQEAQEEIAEVMESIPNSVTLYEVDRMVDGDTIAVVIDGESTKVRLLGIDTPETVDPRKGVECFGKEASTYLAAMLEGKHVSLIADETQDDADRYGRLLRYVVLPDGTDVNGAMIENGYAFEYTYDVPYRLQTKYQSLEDDARINERGLWAEESCNGER